MPIFFIKPIPALLEDPDWRVSPYKGPCWVNAENETEARRLIAGRYEDANANNSAESDAPSPWMQPRLAHAEVLPAPPEGMTIPLGVVVAELQY
ncbi:MAG TPA: hypothetical protein VGC80_00805 [Acetobacteraceae bacterium]